MKRRDFTLGGLACVIGGAAIAKMQQDNATAQRASPQVLRLSRNLQGKTVNLRDYCAADGRRIDTQSYQELLDLKPARIIYPADTRLVIDRQVRLRSDQAHLFSTGAAIEAEVDDYAIAGIGETSENIANLVQAIPRYSRMIRLDRPPETRAGDIIVLADVSDPKDIKLDINVVEQVAGATIATRYDIGRPFADRGSVLIHKLYNPIRNVRLLGKVAAENHSKTGGFLRFLNASDIGVSGLEIRGAGYIGMSFESSLNGVFRDIAIRGAGASGLGFRATKGITVDGFVAQNVRADESLTFYDNVSHVDATNISIRQYLHQERQSKTAGNNILIDRLCSKINVSNITCVGSATCNVMINNQSDDCSVDNYVLRQSNLGGIRVSARCRNAAIGNGTISDVMDTMDQEARKTVSAISIGATCTGTSISKEISFERISTGINVARFPEKIV